MKIEDRIRDDLWKAIQAHYERTDYTEAVRDAVFHMSEVLREKGGIEDKDGTKLVETALLGNNPAILVNKNESTTEKDFQQGIGFAFKGIMQSVRNPLSHESFQYTQDEAEVVNGVKFIAKVISDVHPKELKAFIDEMSQKIGSGVIVLATDKDGKASIVVGVTKDLTSKYNAVDLVKIASAQVGGQGGGGRPDMAQAGGSDASKLNQAFEEVKKAL